MDRVFSLPMTPAKTHLTDKISKPPAPKPHRVSRKEITLKRKTKEGIFAREYVKDLNGTRAAVTAGYPLRSAGSVASRLLKKRNVKALVAKLIEKQAEKLEISADKVLAELGKIGFHSGPLDIKLTDKIRSLELLGKYLKLFVEKVEVTGLGDLPAVLAAARARAQRP